MEPRPQSPRPAHGQSIPRQPASPGRGPEETAAYRPQHDPASVVAPPRTDYDYSPLDLAPPGQRRRRQLVAAGLGGLVMMLLIAAIVFAFLVLREDDGDTESDLAALTAQLTATAGAQQASTPAATTNPGEAPAGDPNAGAAPPTATSAPVDAAGEQAAGEPTPPPAQTTAGGPTQEELLALLPTADMLPVTGLDQQPDSALALADVVTALGGSRDAEANLARWGWTANAQRSFTAADPAALASDATTDMSVSLHSFANDAAAAEALTYYSDILLNSGFQEVEVGDIGTTNRMLVQAQAEGGTNVALYVQQGAVLYRIGGYSPAGDPTQNVIALAQAMIGQQAATGQ